MAEGSEGGLSADVQLITKANDKVSGPVESSPDARFVRYAETLTSLTNKAEYRGYDTLNGCEISWVVVKLDHIAQNMRKRYLEELKLITKLDHENIIHCLGAWHSPNKNEIVFVRELMMGGNLRSHLKRFRRPKLNVIKTWGHAIVKGLSYLHDMNLIHRDIRCDNVFINGSTGEIRIGDLSYVTSISSSHASSHVGKPEYMPPEVVDGRITHAIDIYCFGMMIMEIATGEKPYLECCSPAHIYRKLIDKTSPMLVDRILDENVKTFIMKCINPEFEQRPTSKDLVDDPFFQNIDDNSNKQYVELGPEIDYEALKLREKKKESASSPGGEGHATGHHHSGKKHHHHRTHSHHHHHRASKAEEDLSKHLPMTEEDSSFATTASATTIDTSTATGAGALGGMDGAGAASSESGVHTPTGGGGLGAMTTNDSLAEEQLQKVKISIQVIDNNQKHHEVSFDFDLSSDTPRSVATEMMEDLDLPESQYDKIVATIRRILDDALAGHSTAAGNSPSGATPGVNPVDGNTAISPVNSRRNIHPQSSSESNGGHGSHGSLASLLGADQDSSAGGATTPTGGIGNLTRPVRQSSRQGDTHHKRPLENSPFRKNVGGAGTGSHQYGDPDLEEAERHYRIHYQKLSERHKTETQLAKERNTKALEELFLANLLKKFEAGTLLSSSATGPTVVTTDITAIDGSSPSRGNHGHHHHHSHHHHGHQSRRSSKALLTTGKITSSTRQEDAAASHQEFLSTSTVPTSNLIDFSPVAKHKADDEIHDSAEEARREAMLSSEGNLNVGLTKSVMPRPVSDMNLPAIEKYYQDTDQPQKDISLLDMDVSRLKRRLSPDSVAVKEELKTEAAGTGENQSKPEVTDLLELESKV